MDSLERKTCIHHWKTCLRALSPVYIGIPCVESFASHVRAKRCSRQDFFVSQLCLQCRTRRSCCQVKLLWFHHNPSSRHLQCLAAMRVTTAKLPHCLLITGMPVLFVSLSCTGFAVTSTNKTAFGFKMSVACASVHSKGRTSSLRWRNFLPYLIL